MHRYEITIEGVVQGVGFRPYIYGLATRMGLSGFITNSSNSVVIQVQSRLSIIERFIDTIPKESPPLAAPQIISVNQIEPVKEEKCFTIRPSCKEVSKKIVVSADAATCNQCKAELLTPSDRRYKYPFINCTNCGPRYTILSDIPYDRVNTTMHKFKMCDICQNEYDSPDNRRYHAQPNACNDCGPQLWLSDSYGKEIARDTAIENAINFLERGKIIAVKGLGGFHLAARADDDNVIEVLRNRKFRKSQAFALMIKDIEIGEKIADIGNVEKELMASPACPIVLCKKTKNDIISKNVAPNSRFQGLMLPYTPLHILLMQGNYPALVMTSGNRSGEPIETENIGAIEKLGKIADYLLMHNRDIYTCCDDSIVKVFNGKPMTLRRSRGYVPAPITAKRKHNKQIIAFGSDLKNTVSLANSQEIYISQHIGDVENSSAYEHMNSTVEKLQVLVDLKPDTICCDLHPSMMTTEYAKKYNMPLIQIQHHHAHIAAVMGEYNLEGPVIGLAADGLGYGDDGEIWGCEFILSTRETFKRLGSLKPIEQPGGDKAAKEPWRMSISYLAAAFGLEAAKPISEKTFPDIGKPDIDIIISMIDKKFNCPETSSLGRLFDAVSAILGICLKNSYEAQAAIELEFNAKDTADSYKVIMSQDENLTLIDPANIIEKIVDDINQNINIKTISGKFHNWVADAAFALLDKLAKKHNCRQIALAGGVFQNDILLQKLVTRLQNQNYEVYFNRKIPVNDGSISFGQAIVADAILSRPEPVVQ